MQSVVQQKSYFNREEGSIHRLMDAIGSDIEQAKKPIVEPKSASSSLQAVCPPLK
jgi:hypothetical protein